MESEDEDREIDPRQPEFCCLECGEKHGGEMRNWPQYFIGTCDACNKEKVAVTTPNYWGMFTLGWEENK